MGCSGDIYREIVTLLQQHGAVQKKSKKHRHWVFPNGDVWIVPNSPRSGGYYYNRMELRKYLRPAEAVRASAGGHPSLSQRA